MKIKKFVEDFYNEKITNEDIVHIVEDEGISIFFRKLYMYLYNNYEKYIANYEYAHISQAYHKARIYFDEN